MGFLSSFLSYPQYPQPLLLLLFSSPNLRSKISARLFPSVDYNPPEMMLDGWLGFAVALLGFIAGIVGVAWAVAGSVGLKRRVLSLEYDVADLQERLLREIKSRAGKAGVKAKQDDELFAEAVTQSKSPPQTQSGPWWMPFVHQDLKGN